MKIRELRPGMCFRDNRLGRDVRVTSVRIDGDHAMVWLSNDGREAVPFPYDADDEIGVAPLSREAE